MKAIFILSSLLLVGGTGAQQTEKPVNPQKLVPPSSYTRVPAQIRNKLQAHGCYLPEIQSVDNGAEAINVISGHFGGQGEMDWAAVCVIRDRAQILLMWSRKPAACPPEIHSGWPLKENFSAEPAGGIFLRRATTQRILSYRRAFPEGPTPAVAHDGLEVGDEQASLIFYCDAGKWLQLRGND